MLFTLPFVGRIQCMLGFSLNFIQIADGTKITNYKIQHQFNRKKNNSNVLKTYLKSISSESYEFCNFIKFISSVLWFAAFSATFSCALSCAFFISTNLWWYIYIFWNELKFERWFFSCYCKIFEIGFKIKLMSLQIYSTNKDEFTVRCWILSFDSRKLCCVSFSASASERSSWARTSSRFCDSFMCSFKSTTLQITVKKLIN